MAIFVDERKESRGFSGGEQLVFKYTVFDTETPLFDIDAVYAAVFATAVNPFGIWRPQFQKISIDPQGGGVWYVDLPYGVGDIPITGAPGAPPGLGGVPPPPPPSPAPDDILGPEWSFDTTGGTTHITQGISNISADRRGDLSGAPAVTFNAIGIDKDKVNGVDITSPTQRITYTVKMPVITMDYLMTIERLTGSVNDAPYLNREAGELLFLGASGSFKQVEGFTITFTWAFSPNLPKSPDTEITICTGLAVTSKKGWEHLWVTYTEEATGGYPFQRPLDAYVDQIYPEKDFDELGLFT